jgi:hypothetical protein
VLLPAPEFEDDPDAADLWDVGTSDDEIADVAPVTPVAGDIAEAEPSLGSGLVMVADLGGPGGGAVASAAAASGSGEPPLAAPPEARGSPVRRHVRPGRAAPGHRSLRTTSIVFQTVCSPKAGFLFGWQSLNRALCLSCTR